MEKTNLYLAFIVRRWVIETLVLSQNANRNPKGGINTARMKGFSYYGFWVIILASVKGGSNWGRLLLC